MLKVSVRPDLFPAADADIWLRIEPARIRWMDRESRTAIEAGATPPGTEGRARRPGVRGRDRPRPAGGGDGLASRCCRPRAGVPRRVPPGVGVVGCRGSSSWRTSRQHGVRRRRRRRLRPRPVGDGGDRDRFPVVGRVFESLDGLLADPAIEVVDIATHRRRPALVRRAIDAGKHVLSGRWRSTSRPRGFVAAAEQQASCSP